MVDPWNVTHVMANPDCMQGIGCFVRNVNDVGAGWPVPVIMLLAYAIALFVSINKGVDAMKAFIGCTFFLFFMFLMGYIYHTVSDKLLMISFIALVALATIKVISNK
jgi:hypothetical protein